MKINELIDSHSELTDTSSNRSAVVLMTRIRLARNLRKHPFPGWAKDAQKREIREQCMQAVAALPQMKREELSRGKLCLNSSINKQKKEDHERRENESAARDRCLVHRSVSGYSSGSAVMIFNGSVACCMRFCRR